MFKRLQFAFEGRDPNWSIVRKIHLKKYPTCAACDCREKLEVHHMVPFHVNKELELDPTNLLTLCRHCHLVLGHLRDYDLYNKYVNGAVIYFRSLRELAGR